MPWLPFPSIPSNTSQAWARALLGPVTLRAACLVAAPLPPKDPLLPSWAPVSTVVTRGPSALVAVRLAQLNDAQEPVSIQYPRPAHGIGDLEETCGDPLGRDAQANALKVLSNEPAPNLSTPYGAAMSQVRRQLSQLGLLRVGRGILVVDDLASDHARTTTRAIAGKTGPVAGASVMTGVCTSRVEMPPAPENAALPTMAKYIVRGVVSATMELRETLNVVRRGIEQRGDGQRVFLAMPWSGALLAGADALAQMIAAAPPGSPLYEDTKAALGHAPSVIRYEWGPSLAEFRVVAQKVIAPALRAAWRDPSIQAEVKAAREALAAAALDARKSGVLAFQSAGNAYERALSDYGDPWLGEGTSAGIPNLILVGSVKNLGGMAGVNGVSPFSAPGQVAGPGEDIPVDEVDGQAQAVSGTSYSAPILAATAYLMNAINPRLSLDQLEALLTNPKVAIDVPGTDRDGAGAVDVFAAALLAHDPQLTRGQIERIRRALDESPQQMFDLEALIRRGP